MPSGPAPWSLSYLRTPSQPPATFRPRPGGGGQGLGLPMTTCTLLDPWGFASEARKTCSSAFFEFPPGLLRTLLQLGLPPRRYPTVPPRLGDGSAKARLAAAGGSDEDEHFDRLLFLSEAQLCITPLVSGGPKSLSRARKGANPPVQLVPPSHAAGLNLWPGGSPPPSSRK